MRSRGVEVLPLFDDGAAGVIEAAMDASSGRLVIWLHGWAWFRGNIRPEVSRSSSASASAGTATSANFLCTALDPVSGTWIEPGTVLEIGLMGYRVECTRTRWLSSSPPRWRASFGLS